MNTTNANRVEILLENLYRTNFTCSFSKGNSQRTFFKALHDVADVGNADRDGDDDRLDDDTGTEGEAGRGDATAGAAAPVVAAPGAASQQLAELTGTDATQGLQLTHAGVERADRHTHVTEAGLRAACRHVVLSHRLLYRRLLHLETKPQYTVMCFNSIIVHC